MDAAGDIGIELAKPLTWTEICEKHPNEWVCLVEIERESDGRISSGRVVGHHRSINEALNLVDSWSSYPMVAYSNTGKIKLPRFPRIEMTDDLRELVRARR